MEKLIKRLFLDRKVIFSRGKFDNWCVFVVEKSGEKKAPFDVDYFSDILELSVTYTPNKVYTDFNVIYNMTTDKIDPKVSIKIDEIVNTYNDKDKSIIEQCFTVLYAGMIAEENKANSILKKRIKRLGIHQILVDKITPEIAADFSKDKKWYYLDNIMKEKGF